MLEELCCHSPTSLLLPCPLMMLLMVHADCVLNNTAPLLLLLITIEKNYQLLPADFVTK
jgi:hypothetical protein